MALPRPGCGPCGQPHQRRRLLGLTACIVVLLLAAPWLRMVGAAAYAVAWWSLAPQVQWARPGSAAAPAPAAAPVPKLMHQTWQTKQVPAKWAAARQSCLDLHPDFEHRLWTDEEGLAFIKVRAGLAAARRSRQAPGRRLQPGRPIGRLWSHKRAPGGAVATQRAAADACPDASTLCSSTGQTRSAPPCLRPVPQKHYPWFLPTYVAYPYSIQRVDVLRYFLLHHYGGIYIDLDSEWHFEAGAAGSWRERAVPAGVFPCCTVLFAPAAAPACRMFAAAPLLTCTAWPTCPAARSGLQQAAGLHVAAQLHGAADAPGGHFQRRHGGGARRRVPGAHCEAPGLLEPLALHQVHPGARGQGCCCCCSLLTAGWW